MDSYSQQQPDRWSQIASCFRCQTATLISPVAKVPQGMQVNGKGEKFNLAYHKTRPAVGRPHCRLGLAVIYSFCLLSASHHVSTSYSSSLLLVVVEHKQNLTYNGSRYYNQRITSSGNLPILVDYCYR